MRDHNILLEEELKILFSNIAELIPLNERFLDSLLTRVKKIESQDQTLGEVYIADILEDWVVPFPSLIIRPNHSKSTLYIVQIILEQLPFSTN